jgi:hypothetical protein
MFNSQFTQNLKPFGTVRFMDAMDTNGNSAVMNSTSSSSNPPPPGPQTSDPKWNTGAGMPLAAMVKLANETNTNPWFNIPANATPAYISQFASYVKNNLDSNLKVYVEYGNEDWAGGNPANTTIANGGATEGTTFDSNWAKADEAVFQDWEKVYTGSSSGVSSSIVRVAAFQTSNSYDTPYFLSDLHAAGGFDAIADAPYFGPTTANIASYGTGTTAQQILNDMIADIKAEASATPSGTMVTIPGTSTKINLASGDWAWNKQFANFYGVPLIGYEGGQGLAPNSTSVQWYDAYVAAEESPEMEQIYDQWLQTYLGQIGASEVNQYNAVSPTGEYGAWGLQEYQDQTIGDAAGDSAKYQGVLDYLSAVPEPATVSLILPAGCLLISRRRRRVA